MGKKFKELKKKSPLIISGSMALGGLGLTVVGQPIGPELIILSIPIGALGPMRPISKSKRLKKVM